MIYQIVLSFFLYHAFMTKNVYSMLPVNLPINNPAFDQHFYLDQLDSELCLRQLSSVRNNSLILIQFLESGLRIPRSITEGNIVDLGNYHQCLAIDDVIQDTEVQGKYCKISVSANQSLDLPELPSLPELGIEWPEWINLNPRSLKLNKETEDRLNLFRSLKSDAFAMRQSARSLPDGLGSVEFTLAVCVPKACTTQEGISGLLFNTTAIGFQYEDIICRLPNDKPFVPGDYVAITIFSVIGLITLLSTSYDLYSIFIARRDPKSLSTLGRSFSLYTNTKRLLNFTTNPGALECIDGIRAIAMMWVIAGHTFFTMPPIINTLDGLNFVESIRSVWLTTAPITVDTFFLLSGLLLVYTTAGKLSSKSLLNNLHLYYLNRLLRMFPLLAAVILCQISIFHRLSDGPLWEVEAIQTNACRENWWHTLLYVQNIISLNTTAGICLGHSWYLAIDMQLHILSPIVLFWVLSNKKKKAWISLIAALLVVLTASTTYNFIKKLPGSSLTVARRSEIRAYNLQYYLNTLARASPFFVGMIFGYLIHSWREKKLEISKKTTALFWICTFTMTTAALFCIEPMKNASWDNQTYDSLVNSFMRPIWVTGIGSIIFLCVNGYGGPINWFLSLQLWKLPSRISYAMYLFHFPIMYVITGSYTAPLYFTVEHSLYLFLAQFAIAFMVGYLMTLVFDSPFSTIFKILLGGGIKKKKITEDTRYKEDKTVEKL